MVDVRVTYGKAILFRLDSATSGVLDVNNLGVGETEVDISGRLVSLSVNRGRQDVLEPVRSGNATVTLRNRDGELDPLNPESSLFPGVEPARSLNIYAGNYPTGTWAEATGTWADGQDGATWVQAQVFAGIVEDIELDFDASGDAYVQVSAFDELSRLALSQFPPEGVAVSQESSGARVTSVLDSDSAFWSSPTSIATGDSTLAAGTATGSVVQYLNTVARSEGGVLFVGREGDLVFRNRTFAVTADPVVMSDDGVEIAYDGLQRQSSGEALRTVAFGERAGVRRERRDSLGVTRFGFRAVDLGELFLLDDNDVDARLDYELSLRSEPNPTVRQVSATQLRAVRPELMKIDLGDPIVVYFTPPNVPEVRESGVVLNLRHDFTVGAGWRTTVGMTPYEFDDVLIFGVGRLDFDELAF
jgi:hypothetical protein